MTQRSASPGREKCFQNKTPTQEFEAPANFEVVIDESQNEWTKKWFKILSRAIDPDYY